MSMGMIGGAALGGALDIASSGLRNQEARKQHARNKDMADYMHEKQLDMWEKTNYKAQADQLRKAGMNIGLMYGSAGQGGQTSAVSGEGGKPSTQNPLANTSAMAGMGIQNELARAQKENIEAQTTKTEAETENIIGGVRENLTEDSRGKKFNNDINERYKDLIEEARTVEWDTAKIKGEEANAAWEFKKAIEYGQKPETEGGAFTNENSRIARAKIAEMQGYEEDLKKAKINNDIAEAEKIIKEFEAEMTKQGISPNSPWYAKLITDLLNKVGLLDLIGIGQGAVKKEVKQITK